MNPEDLGHTLGVIETKVDQVLSAVLSHETRIRALEKWQWRIAGALALATLAITWYTRG